MPKFATMLCGICFALLAAASSGAGAAGPDLPSDDPVLEKRVAALSSELRCLVCQNQTLADSHADLAIDLKKQVREKLASGMSERQVVDYLVERYGDFVLYRPPLRAATMLLWAGPFLLLACGLFVLLRVVRRRAAAGEDSPERASAADMKRAAALLESDLRSDQLDGARS
ncbi:cytochrome c-type biogenesis protein [Noviherbaspirillum galbum]|uniref:Cytochrome c-type biogenesis protein n=1 Tax=Noviherbaspirillum galbum TaxID=2709383 RepID=A0A6B3ST45_9BURK|nr:cytochrome c-type biogenesis protein [Noviherbaspirillum galbum]NEX61582.1 cytochrome c-type biogenesis protein CcmH [Noviherbaspirillum galbum]